VRRHLRHQLEGLLQLVEPAIELLQRVEGDLPRGARAEEAVAIGHEGQHAGDRLFIDPGIFRQMLVVHVAAELDAADEHLIAHLQRFQVDLPGIDIVPQRFPEAQILPRAAIGLPADGVARIVRIAQPVELRVLHIGDDSEDDKERQQDQRRSEASHHGRLPTRQRCR
jgi:hypothetical protein